MRDSTKTTGPRRARRPVDEQEIWSGHTSQLVNAKWILGAVYGFWLVYPLVVATKKFLELHCHKYLLTDDQLIEVSGILNRDADQMDLFRITDVSFRASWIQRIFGLGDVKVVSTDQSHPTLSLQSIHDPKKVASLIRHYASEAKRDSRHLEVNMG